MWVLTMAVGCFTVCHGLVLPMPCPSPLSCIHLLLNAWYASASFRFSPASGFLQLLSSLTPEDAQVGVSSKESLTNEGKVSSVHPMRTELGKVSP